MPTHTIIETTAFDYIGFDVQDLQDLYDLSDCHGSYWTAAFRFVVQLRDRDRAELTPRQVLWAQRLKVRLASMRSKERI